MPSDSTMSTLPQLSLHLWDTIMCTGMRQPGA